MSEKKWRALDHCDKKDNKDATVHQEADQVALTKQTSYEWIIVKDSEGITVSTTDTQVAVSLQAALQAAIVAVIRITIGDSDRSNAVAQELTQFVKTKQKNKQKTVIECSKNVHVTTTDTDIAVNLQVLLQVLVAIIAQLDVL